MKNDLLQIKKGYELKEGEFSFGVSIDLPEEKMFRLTGIYPAPAMPDHLVVANIILDFFNGHLGTNFVKTENRS